MVTWKEAEPPKLAPVGWGAKLIGGVRIAVVVVMTLVCLALFLLGKGAKRLFGDRVRFHYLVARLWSRAVLALLGVRRRVRGAPIQKGGVLTANHASWLDIISMRSVTRINFVSKAEVRDWPGVGLIADICETVFIERKRTAAKRQQVELEGRMRRDELLCIFPEGTRNRTDRPLAVGQRRRTDLRRQPQLVVEAAIPQSNLGERWQHPRGRILDRENLN